MTTTADIMTPDPIVVTADTPLGDAARRMLEHGLRHLPVVDAQGRALHYVSDVSVFRYGGPSGEDMELWIPFQTGEIPNTCGEIQAEVDAFVAPDTEITTALRVLLESPQDFLLVQDATNDLVGIITEHDGLRVAVEALEDSDLSIEIEAVSPVIAARPSDPASQILSSLQDRGIRHILVVDEDGGLAGVVSTGDLLADSVMHRPELTIRDVMRPKKAVTITPRQRLVDAASTMLDLHIGSLPVVDEIGQPQGILTRTDLIQAALAALEERAAFGGEA